MTPEAIVQALKGSVPALQAEIVAAVDMPTFVVPREQIIAVLTAFRDEPSLQFRQLSELTAVDWWPGQPRFQVVYHLTSIDRRLRVRIKVPLFGEDAHIATATGLWPGANWLEREVFDMFGIVFDGHPDLRRVLMPEDWEGYPQRKDYPVQIKLPVKIYEPLEISPEDFQANIERDREARAQAQNPTVRAAQGSMREQTKATPK